MKREIYYSKRSFSKYDDSHYIVYLNEEVLENFVPETFEGDKAPEPQIAYAYTGPEEDGNIRRICFRACTPRISPS